MSLVGEFNIKALKFGCFLQSFWDAQYSIKHVLVDFVDFAHVWETV